VRCHTRVLNITTCFVLRRVLRHGLHGVSLTRGYVACSCGAQQARPINGHCTQNTAHADVLRVILIQTKLPMEDPCHRNDRCATDMSMNTWLQRCSSHSAHQNTTPPTREEWIQRFVQPRSSADAFKRTAQGIARPSCGTMTIRRDAATTCDSPQNRSPGKRKAFTGVICTYSWGETRTLDLTIMRQRITIH